MLQGIGNAQTKRACALIGAFEAREITLDEFADALRSLPSEVLQIIATMLALHGLNEQAQPRLMGVHAVCSRLAAVSRVLS